MNSLRTTGRNTSTLRSMLRCIGFMLALLATSADAQNPTHNHLIGRSNPALSGFHFRGSLPTQDSSRPALRSADTLSGVAVSYGTMDYPRVLNSGAAGMNKKGQIVGGFNILAESGCTGGYLQAGTSFRKIAYPGSTASCTLAINDLGEIVGDYTLDGGNTYHAFLLVGTVFSAVPDPPSAISAIAEGVDNLGNIVGAYVDSSDAVHGFVYSNGAFTVVDVPGAGYTHVHATSPNGTILVGDYVASDGHDHGFRLKRGVLSTVDYPGATDTQLLGVNDSGDYVGNWGNGAIIQDYLEYNGFLFRSGSYVSLTLPWAGVSVTWPSAVNDKDQIAGSYVDSNGIILGFYASAH